MTETATIAAHDAHIWYNNQRLLLTIDPFRYHQDVGLSARGFICDAGASETRWREMSPEERLLELYEMAIDFMVAGHDPIHVIREFAKIREFAELGGQNSRMCCALTRALEGQALDDPDGFRERHLEGATDDD